MDFYICNMLKKMCLDSYKVIKLLVIFQVFIYRIMYTNEKNNL